MDARPFTFKGPSVLAGYLVLIPVLALICVFGSYAAYFAMIAALSGFIFAFDRDVLSYLLSRAWVRMFIAAYILIAAAFIATANTLQENLMIFDFLQLLLIVPAGLLFSKMSRPQAIDAFTWLAFAGVLLSFGWGIVSVFVLGTTRANGFESSPIHYAYFALILGFLSLAGFFVRDAHPSPVLLLGPFLAVVTALMTGTRGGVVVFAILTLVFFGFYLRHMRIPRARKIWILVAAIAVFLALLPLVHHLGFSRATALFADAPDILNGDKALDASTSYRIEHVRAGWQAFLDSPWIGHGWQNQLSSALPHMSKFAREGFALENWAYLHNEFISLAVSAGLLGIAAYILIFLAPLTGALRAVRDSQFVARFYGVSIVAAAFWAGGLTEVLFKYEAPKTFSAFVVTALLIWCRDAPIARPKRKTGA